MALPQAREELHSRVEEGAGLGDLGRVTGRRGMRGGGKGWDVRGGEEGGRGRGRGRGGIGEGGRRKDGRDGCERGRGGMGEGGEWEIHV